MSQDDTTLDPNTPISEDTAPETTQESTSTQDENTTSSGSTSGSGSDFAAEIAQLRDQLMRLQADYANLVRRTREESAQIGEWSENKTILKFLPTLDNLERSLEHIPAELSDNAWIAGIQSIVRSLQRTVSDFGITPMESVGQEVNPDLHEVISQIPAPETTIKAEVEKGYMRSNKALRHAKVIVGDGSQT